MEEITYHVGTACLFLELMDGNLYILQIWGCKLGTFIGEHVQSRATACILVIAIVYLKI